VQMGILELHPKGYGFLRQLRRYIQAQIGDPGYLTQTSLFSQEADGRTSSAIVDGLYGYRSVCAEMTKGAAICVTPRAAPALITVRRSRAAKRRIIHSSQDGIVFCARF